LLGAHLADLLFTDRRWRDGLLFSFVKRAAESEAAVAYPVRLRMPPCSHRPVTAVRCAAGHRDRRDRCASDRRTARGSLHRTWRKPDAESRPADVTAELRSRPKRYLPGVAFFREDRWSNPAADRKGDSDHASKVGESIHGRRLNTQNDAVSVSNTLAMAVQSPPGRKRAFTSVIWITLPALNPSYRRSIKTSCTPLCRRLTVRI